MARKHNIKLSAGGVVDPIRLEGVSKGDKILWLPDDTDLVGEIEFTKDLPVDWGSKKKKVKGATIESKVVVKKSATEYPYEPRTKLIETDGKPKGKSGPVIIVDSGDLRKKKKKKKKKGKKDKKTKTDRKKR